jgi:hypothetical protein
LGGGKKMPPMLLENAAIHCHLIMWTSIASFE